MLNFYHRFLPNIASTLRLLTDATKGKGKAIEFTKEQVKSFQAAKEILASAVMLHHPDSKCPTKLTVDASDFAIGAELSQLQHGFWKPIAFFSRKLSATQQRYSTFDRELLAIYSAIRHFRYFLDGRPFCILTDHKPLTYAFSSVADRSPRQERQLSFISEFSTDIQHISGVDNIVPDALSRAPIYHNEPQIAASNSLPQIQLKEIAEAQKTDPEMNELIANPGSLRLQ